MYMHVHACEHVCVLKQGFTMRLASSFWSLSCLRSGISGLFHHVWLSLINSVSLISVRIVDNSHKTVKRFHFILLLQKQRDGKCPGRMRDLS